MRQRTWVLLALTMALVIATACVSGRVSRLPATLVPTKTLRPTFTPTQPPPSLEATVTVSAAAPSGDQATPEPAQAQADVTAAPTAAPAATEAPAGPVFTVNSQTVNVRSGPGTNFAIMGKLAQGEKRPLTGMNQAGDWWQFDYNGKQGWVFGQNVTVTAVELVKVAQDIPVAPTARPRPTARPQPVQPRPVQPTAAPAPPPAAATLFVQEGSPEFRNAESAFDILTFWGRLGKRTESAIGGYKLRVTAPSGTVEVPFNPTWERAYAGYGASEFLYNAKAEVPHTSGGYRAVVIDGSGNEVSDAVTGTVLGQTHDVLITWVRR
jgi:uncharacterized protein YgiM (DUF1202 family)